MRPRNAILVLINHHISDNSNRLYFCIKHDWACIWLISILRILRGHDEVYDIKC